MLGIWGYLRLASHCRYWIWRGVLKKKKKKSYPGLDNTHCDVSQFQGNSLNTVKLIKRYAAKGTHLWNCSLNITLPQNHLVILLQCKSYKDVYYWPLGECGPDRCLGPKGDLAFVLIPHSKLRVMTTGQIPDCTLSDTRPQKNLNP